MCSANREFYFFLSNLDISVFLFLSNCSARISSIMPNDKSGHSCLVSDLREKTFSFSLLSMMLAVSLS